MTYTEKELDQFLHGISLSLLSKKSAQHWRYDEETAKEIEWLEVLERKVRADKADRKTEPTISKMEQVEDEPQLTPNYCGTCKHRDVPCGDLPCDMCKSYSAYEPMDEPQTSCKTCRYGEVDEGYVRCAYYSKATEQDEPQTERSSE